MTQQMITSRVLSIVSLAFLSLTLFMPQEAAAKASKHKIMQPVEQALFEVVDPEDHLSFAEAELVSAQDMGEMRAGFIDPTGLIFKFAVDVKSHIDGALMFVRSLVLEPMKGSHEMQIVTNNSQAMPENLPQGTAVDVIKSGAGVVVSNENGKTTIINQPSSGIFSNVILNSANNRDISQTMNIDLVLQNVKTNMGQFSGLRGMNSPAHLFQSSRMHAVGFGL